MRESHIKVNASYMQQKYVPFQKGLSSLKAITSYHTTPLSNYIGPIS